MQNCVNLLYTGLVPRPMASYTALAVLEAGRGGLGMRLIVHIH